MGIDIKCNPDFHEKRHTRRNALEMACTVRERARTAASAEIRDFSANGVRIISSGSPVTGNQIWVKLTGLESLCGRIAWTNGSVAGIEFERPLHPAVALRFEPAARQMEPSYEERPAAPDNVVPLDPLLSRREQIIRGVTGSDLSPLKHGKQPTRTGMLGSINRAIARRSNHRHEPRYSDITTTSQMTLLIRGTPAKIEDVSNSGLRIKAELWDNIGANLSVEFDGFEPIEGKLIWLGNGEAGISLPPESLELNAS